MLVIKLKHQYHEAACHFNDMCDEYTTLAGRKQVLNQQQRCFICLKVCHVSKDCPSSQKKSCCYCGKKGSHNRCLRPQKFTREVTDSFVITECTCNVSSQWRIQRGIQGFHGTPLLVLVATENL